MPGIGVDKSQLSGLISTARKIRDPHAGLTSIERRPAPPTAPAPIAAPPIEMQEVAVNQDPVINSDSYLPGVELCGGGMTDTLYGISVLTGKHPTAVMAYNEQKAVAA